MQTSLPVKNLPEILKLSLGKDVSLSSVEWKNLTDPGENFGSLILSVNARIVCDSKPETLNLVAKLPPPSTWLQELFNSPFTFQKELQFYRDLTPAFLAVQRENGVAKPEETWLGARYYGGRLGLEDPEKFDNQATILLQNLHFTGYKTVDRIAGLNKKQAAFAVKQLAKLHAIPIAMRIKKPKIFQELVLPALAQPANETAENCVTDMVRKALDDLKEIPEASRYLDAVNKTMEYEAKCNDSSESTSKDQWATLVHNDFWVNNMMFKSDENGNVLDMKIVDFQLCFYDNGVKDLIFFLVSSPTREVIENDFDYLVNLYYESFVDTLKILKVETRDFIKKDFIEQLDKFGPMKLGQCLMMIQVIKSKPGVAPKMEDIHSKENFLSIGGGEVYRQKMLHTVQFFEKRGWLRK